MGRPSVPIGVRVLQHSIPEPNTGCWLWTACVDDDGYGVTNIGYRKLGAHRASYEAFVGPIPEGLTLDHKCRVRSCVNPDHLEPVTVLVNTMRGEGLAARNSRKTHCPRGHALHGGNLYIDSVGRRHCRRCQATSQAAYRQRKAS